MKKTTVPDLFWIFIIAQIALYYLFPIKKIIIYPYTLTGIPLILIGLYLNWVWVADRFRKEKTTIGPNAMPSKFVSDGPFKFTRNPTYLGMALTFMGVAILLGSISTFIIPIIFIVLTDKTVIPIEEKNMEKKFGKKYLEYKKKVRRWI
ncbi:MAG: isoprenylcysteine carboxylmethyltransferase family protein [archaeon]